MNKPTAAAIKAAFADPQSFGTTLLLATVAAYGTEAIGDEEFGGGWSPETLHDEIKSDFRTDLRPNQFGKLMAAITIVNEPSRFVDRAADFVVLANAFNGDSYDPATVDPVDSLESAWAIYEATIIERLFFEADDEITESIPEFSEEIRGYLEHVLQDEGIINPPDILRLASYNPDRMGQVLSDWTDDPEMTSAIYSAMADRTDAITGELKARLELLFQQIATLFGTDVATIFDKLKMVGL